MKPNNVFNYLILFLFLPVVYLYPEGFIANTLVKTKQGYSSIQQLKQDDIVTSFNVENPFSIITQTINYTADSFIKITIGNSIISCASDQLFYSYDQRKWINARYLTSANFLMDDNGNAITIDSLEHIQQPCTLYALSLKTNHTYCVSPYNIVVHNVIPVIFISWPLAPIIVPAVKTCIFAGATLLGIHFAKKTTHKHYASDKNISSSSNNSYYPDPNDPNNEKDKEHPHGIYKDAEYHHKNSSGRKSKCPNDGQRCLDYSLPTVSNQRIAIEGKNFVVLNPTLPGQYHGYIIEWRNLDPKIRNILIKQGFVKKSGKIIKQIMEKSLL